MNDTTLHVKNFDRKKYISNPDHVTAKNQMGADK